jgi:hypothetical protein
VIVAASTLFSGGAAHAQDANASPVFSVEQVRSAFSSAGYQVDQAQDWTWASPPVTSLQVYDSAADRVIVVLVYPSTTAAQAALLEPRFTSRPWTRLSLPMLALHRI